MPHYNFTERARSVFAFAHEEAMKLNHEYVDTEHLLLGMIRDADGVAVQTLLNLNVDLEQLRQSVIGLVPKGNSVRKDGREHGPYPHVDLPYTSRAKKVVQLAMTEARELHHAYVGTEHLLLGILREERGISAQVLMQAGVDHKAVRAGVLRLLGDPGQ